MNRHEWVAPTVSHARECLVAIVCTGYNGFLFIVKENLQVEIIMPVGRLRSASHTATGYQYGVLLS